MKTAVSRKGRINNPDLAYQAEPREVKLRKIISGESSNQPLGTLAGKGVMGDTHKGGDIYIKVDEPSYISGVS